MSEEVKVLSAQDLFGAKLKTRKIHINDLGGVVNIRELTGRQRDEFETACMDGQQRKDGFKELRAKLVCWSVVDSNGKLEFDEKTDLKRINEMSGLMLQTICDEVLKFNNMTTESQDDLKKN